jgi:hypothetical protein
VEELWGCGNVEVFTVSRELQLECRLLRFLGVEKTEGVGEWLRPFSLWRARVAGKPKLSLHSATTSSPVHTPQFLKHSGLDNSPGRSQHLNSRLIIVDSMALTGFNLRDSRNYDFVHAALPAPWPHPSSISAAQTLISKPPVARGIVRHHHVSAAAELTRLKPQVRLTG